MRRSRQGGFSLLEVLVAFAILAISLGVLLQIFSRATIATAASAQYTQAATLAESVLNEVGADIPLEDGIVSGETDSGFQWEIAIQSIDLSALYAGEVPVTPYRVDASVLWSDAGRARRLTLSTLRLGEKL